MFVIIKTQDLTNPISMQRRKTMAAIFETITTIAGGGTPASILKILTSDLESFNLETLFNTFISAWSTFLETLFGMLA